MIKLVDFLRQFRHNNNPDLVYGYDKNGVDAFVNPLLSEMKGLRAKLSSLKKIADGLLDANSPIEYSITMDALLDAIDKAPGQCLASAEADAFDLFLEGIYCHVIETSDLQAYSKKLRGNAT